MSNAKAHAEMLIRKPASEVFDAFVNPRTLERFWLKHASAPLAKGARVEWEFMVEGARGTLTVTEFVQDKRIAFKWSDGVVFELTLSPHDNSGTKIVAEASGFEDKDAVAQAVDATEGFSIVLCDLKSLLETGQSGNMVRDKGILITAKKATA